MAKVQAQLMGATRVRTGVVRLSFPNLFEPRPDTERYDCCLLIDKNDTETIDAINKAVEAAKAKGVAEKWGNKLPKNLQTPLHDGDNKEDDQYSDQFKGMYSLNPKSKSRPVVVDRSLAKIFDKDEIYAGCYVIATISFFPYDSNGNKGVGVGIDNLMKWKDGESLAGKPSAESDFAGLADIEDDEDDDI